MLRSAPIWQDPLLFVSAQAQPPCHLAELAAQPCILPGMGTYTGRLVADVFAQAGLNLKPAMATNYLETIGMLVGVGLGWSVLPARMCGELHALEVTDLPTLARTLGVVTNPQRTLSSAAHEFLNSLTASADLSGNQPVT